MKAFVVAAPLFDFKMSVEGYWLCHRTGDSLLGSTDHREFGEALNAPGLDLVQQVGTEPFAGDKVLFVDINEYQLLMGFPIGYKIEPQAIVVVLPNNIRIDSKHLDKCRVLIDAGYKLACNGVPHDKTILELIQYIILDFSSYELSNLIRTITLFVMRKKVIVSNIPDVDSFRKIGNFSNILFTGTFFSQPITKGVSEISPLKLNIINLLNQVNQEDFDLTEIAETIQQDPSLSISLLRFINNAMLGRTRKIESIRSAVAILGQMEVKRWAAVAISLQLANDRPNELTRLALIRAKFAENLANHYELGILSSTLFMTGLFSLIDVILQKPMAEALREVAVDERVRKALVDKTGDINEVMELIYAYEHADWDSSSINLVRNNVDVEDVNRAFVDALLWYSQLLESIDEDESDESGDTVVE